MIVLALYALSGAAGLILESVFLRQLSLVIGSTAAATTIVLAAFLGGLSAGAAIFGGLADRVERPLRLYGILEIGAGLSAALSVAWLGPGRASLLALLHAAGPGIAGRVCEIAISIALLVVPAALFGGTFPALARLRARQPERALASLGMLYGANTLGGALGAFAAGFFLFEALGIARSGFAAAAADIAIGLAALALARTEGRASVADATAREAVRDVVEREPALRRACLIATALAGGAMLGFEVLWTRLLVLPMRSFAYSFALMLSLFLLGLVIGSLYIADFGRRIAHPAAALAAALAAAGAYVSLTLPWLPALLAPPESASFVGLLLRGTLRAAVVVLPPTALSGVAFPLAVRLAGGAGASMGHAAGEVFAVNTAGSIAGAAIAGLVLLPRLGAPRALALLALLLPLAGAIVASAIRPRRRALIVLALAALVLGAGALSRPTVDFVQAFLRASRGGQRIGRLLFYHEGATDTVAVVTKDYGFFDPDAKSLITNGIAMSATTTPIRRYMACEGHLPILLATTPRSALAIGVGTGITLEALVSHPEVERIDAVELSEGVLRALRSFDGENHRADLDPRVRVVQDDGRRFLARTRESYDVVTVEPPPPIVAGATNLYSLDFYRAIRARLRPGGVVAQWLPLHAQSLDSARMTARTFLAAFPNVRLALPSIRDAVLLGSDAPLRFDLERVRGAYGSGATRASLRGAYLESPEALAATFLLERSAIERWAGDGPLLTDDRPRMEFFGLQSATISDAQIATLLPDDEPDWSWLDRADADSLERIRREHHALRAYLDSESRKDLAAGVAAARESQGTEFFRQHLGCSTRQLALLSTLAAASASPGSPASPASPATLSPSEAAGRLEQCARYDLPALPDLSGAASVR